MASELMERDDLTVYVVGGVPRSFRKKLSKFVDKESRTGGGIKLLDEELSDWVITKLRGETRRSHERTPTSAGSG